MANPRLLIVDDEAGLRDMLADALGLAGFSADVASDGHAAMALLHESAYDLVISDVNMPKVNGFELLERMRASGFEMPVILLTARHDKADVVQGFRVGADDYVSKPFSLEELVLRIKARLRGKNPAEPRVLTCGPIVLDEDAHTVTRNGEPVEISPTEFKLLLELMQRGGKVASKSLLLDHVWDITWATNVTVLDTYISYLRKKLHTDDWAGIKTVRGVGFSIVEK
ncbi:MAG: response regulator transcription factor [Micrococcales bacterium]